MKRRPRLSLLLPLLLSAASPLRAQDWVWWEAENPTSTNFPEKHPYGPYDARGAELLSGGKWIGASEPGKTLFLEYEVAVPKDAEYRFFARKFWKHGPFKWRFDGGPWTECGRDIALLDGVELAKFIGANWVFLGKVKLKAGPRVLRIEMLETKGGGAFDCFLLTPGAFTARGKMKPGEKYGSAPEGWFPFEPDADPFAASPIDLRFLNEKTAGENGFIVARGDQFVHEKTGVPVRFWATNAGHDVLLRERDEIDRYARWHAKLGVNLVRLHGPLWRDDDPARIDEARLAQVHYLAAALKREGIYLNLSTYFPVWFRPKGVPGLEGYGGDKNTFATPFFNERFQELQKGWWKALLTPANPHTGLPLGRDPVVAQIEIVNEDSMFFWTFTPYQNVPEPQMEILERRFGSWLKERHGSLEAVFGKWGRDRVKGDDAAAGRAGFMPLWNLFNGRTPRAQETAEFLALLQRRYFDGLHGYLKKDLGFKGCVTGSNWVTAEARLLGPLDKWSNAGCDFMDRHGYYGGPHEGERAGYSISKGDRYDDASALRFDGGKKGERSFSLPIMDLAWNGKPSTISEINWTPPNRLRADFPLLCAAYGLLQGTDGFMFFATSEPGYSQTIGKFGIATPSTYGQFPATALMYRRGLVKTAEPVARLEVKLADLHALKGIPVSAPQNLDEFRRKDVPAGKALETAAPGSIDPLAFLVGRVEANVTEAGGLSKITVLSPYLDRTKSVAKSLTGELSWNWESGLVTVDAPAAQGATGFLSKAGMLALKDLTIESPLDYGTILLVAMDGQPLRTSRRMLLQVFSEEQNHGWSAPGEGVRAIAETGGPPLVVRKFEGKVALRRPDAAALKVKALDAGGYEDKAAKPGPASALTLLPSTLYYVIEK
jgi:hypothetical protein